MQPQTVERILLACALVFFISGLLFVSPDPGAPWYTTVSAVFILILALPSYLALVSWLGLRRGLAILLVLSLLPLLVEAVAVATGFPYGRFSYSVTLGPAFFSVVPLVVPFAYLPVLLGAVTLGCRFSGGMLSRAVILSTGFVVAADLVIDPAAVHAGFWIWEYPGIYYGIPLSNFAGWALTGAAYSLLFFLLSGKSSPLSCPPLTVAGSLLLIASLWSGYLLRELLLVPALIGIGVALGTGYLIFTRHASGSG